MDPRGPTRPQAASPRGLRQKTSNETASSSAAGPASQSLRQQQQQQQQQHPLPSKQNLPASNGAAPKPAPARPTSKAANERNSPATSSRDNLAVKLVKSQEDPALAAARKKEDLLKTLTSDLESIRSIVTCKICVKLLYEPYVISCGHTYCYSCLCHWFVTNKAKKTCPDCRVLVTQPPAPSYLIREMTNIFINRTELLPSHETTEQHKQWQKEEADIVQKDKNNKEPRTGGLFRGCFRPIRRGPLRPIRDEDDGVDRCPLCTWELEDGLCLRCGAYDSTGTWGDSFGGFSDMDEMSEHDLSSEDLDGEIDMEDDDAELGFDGFGAAEAMDYYDDYDDEQDYLVQRWLASGGAAPQHGFASGLPPRRRAAHSAAGSRRRSYSASIMSDMISEDTEMGILEEEDEEEMEEDSSMNDFIVEDGSEEASEAGASTGTTHSSQEPPRSSQQRHARRHVIPSSSSSERTTEEDDEDEGPLVPGRRRQRPAGEQPTQSRTRRQRVRGPSVSTDGVSEHSRDPYAQGMFSVGYSQLDHGANGEDVEEDDEESDGGRTTVGWEPFTNSIERTRSRNSLTPTADHPNGRIRPPSRNGPSRFLDGSRGLRRRSSVMTVSTDNYEDGEADDDDSEIDRDGDRAMNNIGLRARSSRIRLQPSINFQTRPVANRGNADPDSDDASDASGRTASQGRQRARQQEYNPRISWMFREHLLDLREASPQDEDNMIFQQLEELRSTTPIIRPRTANRNRTPLQNGPLRHTMANNGSMPSGSPIISTPARTRTPVTRTSVTIPAQTGASTRVERSASYSSRTPVNDSTVSPTQPIPNDRPSSVTSNSTNATTLSSSANVRSPPHTPNGSSPSRGAAAPFADVIDRPASRVGYRPPSAAGRRGPSPLGGGYAGVASPGLNLSAQFGQTYARNPFMPYIQVRPRQSQQRLREQSSTATLRPQASRRVLRAQASRINVQDAVQLQNIRTQQSRQNLRTQPSQRRLNSQSSTRTLRANNSGAVTQSAVVNQHSAVMSSPRNNIHATSNLSAEDIRREEIRRQGAELARQRAAALGTQLPTNPFAVHAQARRQSVVARPPNGVGMAEAQQPVARNDSVNSSTYPFPNSPNLARRRSNRSLGPPPGVLASAPAQSSTSMPGFMRPRAGHGPGSPGYEAVARENVTRGMSPMTAGGGDHQRF